MAKILVAFDILNRMTAWEKTYHTSREQILAAPLVKAGQSNFLPDTQVMVCIGIHPGVSRFGEPTNGSGGSEPLAIPNLSDQDVKNCFSWTGVTSRVSEIISATLPPRQAPNFRKHLSRVPANTS